MEFNPIIVKFVYAATVVVVIMTLSSYAVLAERKISTGFKAEWGQIIAALPIIGGIPVFGPFLT